MARNIDVGGGNIGADDIETLGIPIVTQVDGLAGGILTWLPVTSKLPPPGGICRLTWQGEVAQVPVSPGLTVMLMLPVGLLGEEAQPPTRARTPPRARTRLTADGAACARARAGCDESLGMR